MRFRRAVGLNRRGSEQGRGGGTKIKLIGWVGGRVRKRNRKTAILFVGHDKRTRIPFDTFDRPQLILSLIYGALTRQGEGLKPGCRRTRSRVSGSNRKGHYPAGIKWYAVTEFAVVGWVTGKGWKGWTGRGRCRLGVAYQIRASPGIIYKITAVYTKGARTVLSDPSNRNQERERV